VAYDIADDIRRAYVRRILKGCGRPVQESVFECRLTATEFRHVRRRVRQVLDRRADGVRWYPPCLGCRRRIAHLDVARTAAPEGYVVV
jgi:CRISPR-associated protein Cas2